MILGTAGVIIVRARRALRKSVVLLKNSTALAVGTVATAFLGFAYWWLAARLFPPVAIGQASALLSFIALVGLVGEAGFGSLLIGEMVRRPNESRGLVAAATLASGGLAVGLSLALAFAGPHLLSSSWPIDGGAEHVVFFVGCVLTVLSLVADQALVGCLHSVERTIRQVMFSVFKLGLIAAAVVAGYASSAAILLTWVLGLLASWIGFYLLTRNRAKRFLGSPNFGLLYMLRHKIFDHYALDVSVQAPGVIVPYLVMALLSPTTNAAFASLWMLISMASVIPAVMALTLFPVARANPEQSPHDIFVSLAISLTFSLFCAAFILVYSQELLAFFNPVYPDIAGSSLSFLGFSLLGLTLKFHACSLVRVRDWMRKASGLFAFGGFLELSFAAVGAKISGLQGLVVGWTFAVSIEGTCAALFLALAVNQPTKFTPRVGTSGAGQG